MPDTELAEELLQIEEADAWFEYLESTRGQGESRYSELEPWAWARLTPAAACRSRAPCPSAACGGLSRSRVAAAARGRADSLEPGTWHADFTPYAARGAPPRRGCARAR